MKGLASWSLATVVVEEIHLLHFYDLVLILWLV